MFNTKYIPPKYDDTQNYYSLFWRSYLTNEQMLNEIQELGSENFKNLNAIYNLEDYYENNLLPKMLSFPHQYLNMIAQTKQRRDKENEKPERIECHYGMSLTPKPATSLKSPKKQLSFRDSKSSALLEHQDTGEQVLRDQKNRCQG